MLLVNVAAFGPPPPPLPFLAQVTHRPLYGQVPSRFCEHAAICPCAGGPQPQTQRCGSRSLRSGSGSGLPPTERKGRPPPAPPKLRWTVPASTALAAGGFPRRRFDPGSLGFSGHPLPPPSFQKAPIPNQKNFPQHARQMPPKRHTRVNGHGDSTRTLVTWISQRLRATSNRTPSDVPFVTLSGLSARHFATRPLGCNEGLSSFTAWDDPDFDG